MVIGKSLMVIGKFS